MAPDLQFTDVTIGSGFKCALATGGTIYCWGAAWGSGISPQDPAIKECGSSSSPYLCVREPTPISSDQRFTAVASGFYHTCGLAQSGQVFCWGSDAIGAGPNTQESQIPVPVESEERFGAISSAAEGSCAISSAGQPFCWGYNAGSMLGSSGSYLAEPTPIELPDDVVMKTVSLGYLHACAIDTTGAAWCWGTGGLGTGSSFSAAPARVLGGLAFQSLAAGREYTCGISGNGAWWWGANNSGQLGNGGTTDSPISVRVAGQDQFDD